MNSRRSFLKVASLASTAVLTGINPLFAQVASATSSARKVYVFSKHLQWLDYPGMAATAREIGFDGVDLTVRPKGHVLPERVKEDLPNAVEALKAEGLLADRMTTAITDPDDALTLDILETAAKTGVKNYRLGWLAYEPSVSIEKNIENFNRKLKKLAELNKKFGLTAAYQNHAGEMAGSPVWDIKPMLEEIDPAEVGVRYDIRHATIEGGKSWPLGLRLLADHINSIDIKDAVWKQRNGKWNPTTVPLGEGMVDFERFFRMISDYNISGDFTMHFEYPIGGAERGATELSCSPETLMAAMKKDLKILRSFI